MGWGMDVANLNMESRLKKETDDQQKGLKI